jgi:hypothetical protein
MEREFAFVTGLEMRVKRFVTKVVHDINVYQTAQSHVFPTGTVTNVQFTVTTP